MNDNIIRVCNECGKKMKKITTTMDLKFENKKLMVLGVEAYRCEDCDNEIIEDKEFEMIENLFDSVTKPEITILNLDETADLLRVSNQTIYNMIKAGRIKAYKIGREWRFMRSDIEAYLQRSSNDQILTAAKGGKIDGDDLSIIREEVEKRIHE